MNLTGHTRQTQFLGGLKKVTQSPIMNRESHIQAVGEASTRTGVQEDLVTHEWLASGNWTCKICGSRMQERNRDNAVCKSCDAIKGTWTYGPCYEVQSDGVYKVGISVNKPWWEELCDTCLRQMLLEDENIPVATTDSTPGPKEGDETRQGQHWEGGESHSSIQEQVASGIGKGRAL